MLYACVLVHFAAAILTTDEMFFILEPFDAFVLYWEYHITAMVKQANTFGVLFADSNGK